jgi:hypothetical protein
MLCVAAYLPRPVCRITGRRRRRKRPTPEAPECHSGLFTQKWRKRPFRIAKVPPNDRGSSFLFRQTHPGSMTVPLQNLNVPTINLLRNVRVRSLLGRLVHFSAHECHVVYRYCFVVLTCFLDGTRNGWRWSEAPKCGLVAISFIFNQAGRGASEFLTGA